MIRKQVSNCGRSHTEKDTLSSRGRSLVTVWCTFPAVLVISSCSPSTQPEVVT